MESRHGLRIRSSVPFLSYIPGGADEGGLADRKPELVIALDDLAPGQVREAVWRGWPVWVYRRTLENLAALSDLGQALQDPASERSEQPAGADTTMRSLRPGYFVFIPLETSRNCQVRLLEPGELAAPGLEDAVFIEPCYRAHFDPAGRIFRGTGNDTQENLRVPPHRFLDETTLALGPW